LYDCAGNVDEWCTTKYDGGYKPYPYNLTENEWSNDYLESQNGRSLRGGSWVGDAYDCRVAIRNWSIPDFRSYGIGFRIICAPVFEPLTPEILTLESDNGEQAGLLSRMARGVQRLLGRGDD